MGSLSVQFSVSTQLRAELAQLHTKKDLLVAQQRHHQSSPGGCQGCISWPVLTFHASFILLTAELHVGNLPELQWASQPPIALQRLMLSTVR